MRGPVGAVALQASPQELARAHQAPAHALGGLAEVGRDVGGGAALVVAPDDDRAIGLVELQHQRGQALLQLDALERLARRGQRLGGRHAPLAPAPRALGASFLAPDVAQHACEPGTRVADRAALALPTALRAQRAEPRLLHQVLRRRRVAHEPARQGLEPALLPEQLVEGGGARAAVHVHASLMNSTERV